MVDFTVAICTYNGENRLPEVLDRLRSQRQTEHFSWEVLVVDNNSRDRTTQVVQTHQKNWTSAGALVYCFEAEQGAAFARQRAIREANSALIGFLDDDNLPDPNWVAAAYEFGKQYPNAGAYGSRIRGIFEAEPPENFERIQPFFALTDRGDIPLQYDPNRKLLPPAAGLVVRREAWLNSVPDRCILHGRVPGNLQDAVQTAMLPAEDLESLSYIRESGWEIWYNPAMQIEHKIPPHRLQRDYLIPFFRSIGLTRYVTRTIGVRAGFKPILVLAYLANDLRKIIRHWFKYRGHLAKDVVAACEMELYKSSFISPFYLWSRGYLKRRSLSPKPIPNS